MIDKIADTAQAIAAAGKAIDAPGLDTDKGGSFGDVLRDKAMQSIDTLRAGEAASARAVSGEASLIEVVSAVSASELTLQTVVAIRDRMVGAYQEIMRMPV